MTISPDEWNALGLQPHMQVWVSNNIPGLDPEIIAIEGELLLRFKSSNPRPQDFLLGRFTTQQQAEQVALTLRLSL